MPSIGYCNKILEQMEHSFQSLSGQCANESAKRTVWRVIRAQKQFTVAVIIAAIIAIIIASAHCHAAATVGVGLIFADVVNFSVVRHRATSGATAGSLWSVVTAVRSAEGLPLLCLHGSHLVVLSSRCC